MEIDDLTIAQAREIATMFGPTPAGMNNSMIGEYVIVRCRDAGVHAGILVRHSGRECLLSDARRLWYWKPAGEAKFLSGVANHGLADGSKVSEAVNRIHLTENCEIIICSAAAATSIKEMESDAN